LTRDRHAKRSIVFTNGCFDLLHPGHIRTLAYAKSLGDKLIVALNSDRSVKRMKKGKGRPIMPLKARAEVMSALRMVDYVTTFNEPTPERLIQKVRPDVLVKGRDWASDRIAGRQFARRVVRVPLVQGLSTTKIIEKIKRS
jgi:rfaE bifunctional protein nucleotidyltransferase chain/domain